MIFCVTSPLSVGCTFLDWSIHFLSGQTDFFNAKHGLVPLSTNPVTKINAHGHLKNHPGGSKDAQDVIKKLKQQERLTSIYPGPLQLDRVASQLGIDITTISNNEWSQIRSYQTADYNQILHDVYQSDIKIIFISLDQSAALYLHSTRSFERMVFSDNKAESSDEIRKEMDSVFFKTSADTWTNLNLTNIWDLREQRALNIRPFELIVDCAESINLSIPHYWIDSRTWWYDGKNEIVSIMAWLELPIDAERFSAWEQVYNSWQQIQLNILKFQHNCAHIVTCIVNNWPMDIDLTFDQEVIIQHLLIYQHNLNLRTWKLEKFPNNTQELHKLLEPNIHPVTKIY